MYPCNEWNSDTWSPCTSRACPAALAAAILLRESWRNGNKIRKRTLANFSTWAPHLVEGFRILLRFGIAVAQPDTGAE